MLAQIWERATTAQPPLSWQAALLLGALALALTWSPAGYRVVRHVVTLLHEGGHALVAALTGRDVRGVRLHRDSSGLTVSRGRPGGPGMVAVLLAGYPAPALVGVLGALLLGAGYAAGLLWALVLACALLLTVVRNLYGLWVVLLTGAGVAALSWWAPGEVVTGTAYLVVWTLLLAAPRSVVELQRTRARGGRRGVRHGMRPGARGAGASDADHLAALTGVPASAWVVLFWLLCAAALVLGTAVLVLGTAVLVPPARAGLY